MALVSGNDCCCSSHLQEQCSRRGYERTSLRSKIAVRQREILSTLIGNPNFADLELRSKDGLCLAAHSCILRCRVPDFFSCNVRVNFEREKASGSCNKTVVNVATMDSDCLSKFVQYVYANSDDAEAAIASESDAVGLTNEEALIGSSESRLSARTYICENSSTNLASWDGASEENNENGNCSEINSQFKSNESLPSEISECLADCIADSVATRPSVSSEICPKAVSATGRDETFRSGDVQFENQGRTDTSDGSLVETPKGAALFPLFYTMDFSTSGNSQTCNSEVLHASFPRSKNSRARSKSSSLAERRSLGSFDNVGNAEMLLTEHSATPRPVPTPCSKLGADLLSMFYKGQDSDCVVLAKSSRFKSHHFRVHQDSTTATLMKFLLQKVRGKPKAFCNKNFTDVADDESWWFRKLRINILIKQVVILRKKHKNEKNLKFCKSCPVSTMPLIRRMTMFSWESYKNDSQGETSTVKRSRISIRFCQRLFVFELCALIVVVVCFPD